VFERCFPALGLIVAAASFHGCDDGTTGPTAQDWAVESSTGPREGTGGGNTGSYFPLHVGDRWIYELGGPTRNGVRHGRDPETAEVTVMGSHTEDGRQVFDLDGYLFPMSGRELQFFDEAPGQTVELTDRGTGLWYPWSGFPGGEVYVAIPTFGPDCFHGSTGALRALGTVSVPAGTFENAATIDYLSNPCADLGPAHEVLAPGVGLIERRVNTYAGEAIWSLVYANVDGRTWGTPPPRLVAPDR